MLNNCITKGTEGIPRNNIKKSYIPYPINEDFALIVKVVSMLEDTIKTIKIWDKSGSPKEFNVFNAVSATVAIDSYIVIYRVGDYNSTGTNEPELHTMNADNYSWVYLGYTSNIFIKDTGNSEGIIVEFNPDGTHTEITTVPKPLKTLDPDEFYHNGHPPFKQDRIYFGQMASNGYLVWLPGFGNKERTLEATINGSSIKMDVDGQGNVLDVYADEQQYDFWVYFVSNWFAIRDRNNEGSLTKIELRNEGEEIGKIIEHKEVWLYEEDDTEYTNIKIKTNLSAYDQYEKREVPLRWSYTAYRASGKMPKDFTTPFIAYSTDLSKSHLDVLPGCGFYPPTGQIYEASDKFITRCKEFYSDGSTRITTKDITEKVEFHRDSTNSKDDFGCIYSVPNKYQRTTSSIDDTNWLVNGSISAGRPERGFIPGVAYKGYMYRLDVIGATWYWYEGEHNGEFIDHPNYYGSIKFPKSFAKWGVVPTGSHAYYIFLVYEYEGVEMWSSRISAMTFMTTP